MMATGDGHREATVAGFEGWPPAIAVALGQGLGLCLFVGGGGDRDACHGFCMFGMNFLEVI